MLLREQSLEEMGLLVFMIHHYMVHVPVNTSGDEKMIDGVKKRLKELSEAGDVELRNLVHIYESVREP